MTATTRKLKIRARQAAKAAHTANPAVIIAIRASTVGSQSMTKSRLRPILSLPRKPKFSTVAAIMFSAADVPKKTRKTMRCHSQSRRSAQQKALRPKRKRRKILRTSYKQRASRSKKMKSQREMKVARKTT